VFVLFFSLVYVKGFCGDPTPPRNTYVLFSCSVSFNLIKKQQKHSNNKNHKIIFHNKPRSTNQAIPFLFSFLIKFQINFNSTLSHLSFNIKNTNQYTLPLGFLF